MQKINNQIKLNAIIRWSICLLSECFSCDYFSIKILINRVIKLNLLKFTNFLNSLIYFIGIELELNRTK